jgi:hypothetical protein
MDHQSREAWTEIQAGEKGGALRLRDSLAADFTESSIKFLASGYLWLGLTSQAMHMLERAPAANAELSAMLGAAMWCEGQYENALRLWSSRMKLHEPISAQAKRLALLLMAGSMLRSDQEGRIEATAVLASSLSPDSPSDVATALAEVALVSWWQLDLGAYALSKPELELIEWLATFYGACNTLVGNFVPSMDLPHLREAELKNAMSKVVAAVQSDALSIEEFVVRVSCAEFYMARQTLTAGAIIPELPVCASPVNEMLERGHRSEGLNLALAQYRRKPELGNSRTLGFTYLLLEDYPAAWELCKEALHKLRWTSSCFFEIAGTAKWCMGDPSGAVERWKVGMGAQYGDAAGGARVRLLLFAASVLKPNLISRSQARKLLEKKRSQKRIGNWPGYLVRLCLDEKEIDFEFEEARRSLQRRKWEIAFYSALTRFRDQQIDCQELRSIFLQLAALPTEPQSGQLGLGDLMFVSEFYLARYESREIKGL